MQGLGVNMLSSDTYTIQQIAALERFRAQYITSAEIAAEVGVSRISVFNARKSGRLPCAIDVGGNYIWERPYIQPYIDSWRDRLSLASRSAHNVG